MHENGSVAVGGWIVLLEGFRRWSAMPSISAKKRYFENLVSEVGYFW